MKPLVAVLVLFGVLFAGTTVCGLQDGGEAPSPDTLREWSAQFFAAPSLKPEDLFGGCVQAGVITVQGGQTCRLAIKRSDAQVRSARFIVPSGTRALLTLGQEGQFTAKHELGKAGTPFSVDVFQKGGLLTVACIAGNPCRVSLNDASTEP